MASTTFVDYSTVVPAAWLNDVNSVTYTGAFPTGAVSITGITNYRIGDSSAAVAGRLGYSVASANGPSVAIYGNTNGGVTQGGVEVALSGGTRAALFDSTGGLTLGNVSPLTATAQGINAFIYNPANTGAVDSNALLRIQSVNRNANVQVIGGAANEGGFQALNQAGTFVAGFATQYSTGDWVWKTSPGGVATETLRLTQAGLLGVGTTAPFLKFTAANNTTDGVWAGSSGAVSRLGFGGYAGATDGAAQIWFDRSTGDFKFYGGTRDTPVERYRIDTNGNIIYRPTASPPTLATNGDFTFNLTSNTNLRFSYRGSDGVTRVANITLA